MGEENSCAFKCVKISLIVLYVLSIIYLVVFIAMSIIGLTLINSLDSKDGSSQHKLTPEQKEQTSTISIVILNCYQIHLKLNKNNL